MLADVARGSVRAFVLGLMAALAGCSTMQDFVGIPRAGHQKDGTYVPTAEDEKLACRQIRERLDILSRRLKTLPEEAALEQESRPSTVGSALGRMFGGPGAGLRATEQYQRATAESDALNALLVKKQCA